MNPRLKLSYAVLMVVLLLPVLLITNAAEIEPDPESVRPTSSSADYKSSYDTSIDKLLSMGFAEHLDKLTFGSQADDEYAKNLAAIKAATPLNGVVPGDAKTAYDVILQPGHYGRPPGRVGTSGAVISEKMLAAYLAGQTAMSLTNKNYKVLVIPADGYSQGLKARVFLSIHADGSEKACSTGPSLGYSTGTSPMAMHAIGWGLSEALGYQYDDFMKDNFTANLSQYYMFSRVSASKLGGLLEVGELTCATEEKKLIVGAQAIANNVALAIDFILRAGASH